jgi:hypothetical protein
MLNQYISSVKRIRASNSLLVALCAIMVTAGGACNKSGGEAGQGGGGSTASSSASNFEGTISMSMTGPAPQPINVTYYIKGKLARMESTIPGHSTPDSIMLWDSSAGKFTTLLPSQKTYMTADLASMQERAKKQDPNQIPKLTDTGKQETIAGYPCHDWIIEDQQHTEVCVAKGLGDFSMGGGGPEGYLSRMFKVSGGQAPNPDWAKMTEGGAFPLKITATRDGKTSFSLEATSIDRKKVDDSLLSVPPDYKELKAPSIPGVGNPSN